MLESTRESARVHYNPHPQMPRGRSVLSALRDAVFDICDVEPLGPQEDFSFSFSPRSIGCGALLQQRSSMLQFERTPRHVARGGFDHYQVSVFLSGSIHFFAGRREVTFRAGDVFLTDMNHPNKHCQTGNPHSLTFVLPRSLLAPLLTTPDAHQCALKSADRYRGHLISELILFLHARRSSPAAASKVEMLATLVAGSLGQSAGAEQRVREATRVALYESIKRYIEFNLHTRNVDVEALAGRFGVSRASLYRMFEGEGGLAGYVQSRRLHRAFRKLTSPAQTVNGIMDLALEAGFSSDSTFIRAYRRAFGMTPGETRVLAQLRLSSGPKSRSGRNSQQKDAWWSRSLDA